MAKRGQIGAPFLPQLGDWFLYSGGTELLEKFTAEFSASAPVVYKHPPPMGPEILLALGRGVKVSVAIFVSPTNLPQQY